MKDKEKKREVESLLGELAEERFALLVNLGKKITDWGQEEKMQTGTSINEFMFSLNACFSGTDKKNHNLSTLTEDVIKFHLLEQKSRRYILWIIHIGILYTV